MKNYISIVLLVCTSFCISSCAQNRFEHVEQTVNDRYSIVCNGGKYGVFDNNADSLVTALKYDRLAYGKTALEADIEFTLWSCEVDGNPGMLSVGCETNETVEIIFAGDN